MFYVCQTVGKMGLKGVPGLRVEGRNGVPRREPPNGGGGRGGGGRGGGGGYNKGGGAPKRASTSIQAFAGKKTTF